MCVQASSEGSELNLCVSVTLYRTILYPKYLSPLRHLPGPPLFIPPASKNPFAYLTALIKGQYPAILRGDAGIPQREWLKQYGGAKGVVRVVGPFGLERVMFLSPEACWKMLVTDAADYPKVSPIFSGNDKLFIVSLGTLVFSHNHTGIYYPCFLAVAWLPLKETSIKR
jgi:hypothetical protein